MLLKYVIILLSYFHLLASSVKVDMGTCSCNCAPQVSQSPTLSSIFLGGAKGGKFYESIRGMKGEMGRNGDIGHEGTRGPPGEPGERGVTEFEKKKKAASASGATSCVDILADGATVSGVYSIKPTGTHNKIQVYCDLTSNGGGWTLVASVHENNINGKCTVGDNWSSDQGTIGIRSFDTLETSWERFNTFGYPEAATSADYKSPAFFSLSASNVMISHVPNEVEMSQWQANTFLQYYTSNGFLSTHGGSLRTLFAKHYPMTNALGEDRSSKVMRSIAQKFRARFSTSISQLIPNYYRYTYDTDTAQTKIVDGGNDMFDNGNMVFFRIGSEPYKSVVYEREQLDTTSGVQVYSAKSHPFFMLMWVSNPQGAVDSFSIKVDSGTGADSSGNFGTDSDSISIRNMTCVYHAYHVFGASDPSICQVFFYCYDSQTWNSVPPSGFSRPIWSSSTDNLANVVLANGSPQNIMMGYTLLSRTAGTKVTTPQIASVIRTMMTVFATEPRMPVVDCSRLNESLAVPVTYVVGDNDEIMSRMPSAQKPMVSPGFLHFRALDAVGNPYAICPGVKSLSCSPQNICVGSLGIASNSTLLQRQSCGDFAGWGGNPADNATKTTPDGAARALNDVNSSILIFTK